MNVINDAVYCDLFIENIFTQDEEILYFAFLKRFIKIKKA